MLKELAELWKFRYLLQMLIARELKVRYKNSALGFLWSIVPPLLSVVVLSFLVKTALEIRATNYGPYLLCGIIPWTFFSTAVLDSSQSLLINWGVIKKVYMPREVIPLAIIVSNFIHFMLGWAVFFIFYLVVMRFVPPFDKGIPPRLEMLLFPLIVLVQAMLVTGASLWVAALNTFYEDVKFLLQTLFGLVYFVFPIMFPVEVIFYSKSNAEANPLLFKLYMLNPITGIINAFRRVILEPLQPESFNEKLIGKPPLPMDWILFGGSAAISLFILISGYAYFNHVKWKFVERN